MSSSKNIRLVRCRAKDASTPRQSTPNARTVPSVAALQALAPDRKLNEWVVQIVSEGTGKKFELEHNRQWLAVTRPIVEAFFHARYFLEMAVRYGKDLDAPPLMLPSGWAAFLYLYDLR